MRLTGLRSALVGSTAAATLLLAGSAMAQDSSSAMMPSDMSSSMDSSEMASSSMDMSSMQMSSMEMSSSASEMAMSSADSSSMSSEMSMVPDTSSSMASDSSSVSMSSSAAADTSTSSAASASSEPVAQNDTLLAVLWDQTAVEAKASQATAYALGRFRLEQALLDKSWTAAIEQTGKYRRKPPAIVLDVDDTVLNTSAYQAWTVTAGTSYAGKTWDDYVKAQKDTPIVGAIPFLKAAARRGVTIFYVTNRTAAQEAPTVEEMKKMGFPMGNGKVDTFLAAGEKPEWKSAKGNRRAEIAKKYRIVLLFGDNMGDFTDEYTGSIADRDAVFEKYSKHWGRDWIVIPNPTYGSFQSAAFLSDYSKSPDQQRQLEKDALTPWSGPSAQ